MKKMLLVAIGCCGMLGVAVAADTPLCSSTASNTTKVTFNNAGNSVYKMSIECTRDDAKQGTCMELSVNNLEAGDSTGAQTLAVGTYCGISSEGGADNSYGTSYKASSSNETLTCTSTASSMSCS